jgi:PAS domain S-box-containing protein
VCLQEQAGGIDVTGYHRTLDAWRRATAAALDESEERFYAEWEASAETRFRAVWEGTAEAIILTDPDGMVLAVNPAYCTLYGCDPQTRIGHSFAVIFPEAERAEAEANYHAFFTDPDPPRTYEARVQRPDGKERVVEGHCDFVLRDGERVAMLSVIRDITEAQRRERAYRDFVVMANHDLASPLRALRARAKLLQHQQRYDEASVVAILQQTERLERVLTELRELVLLEGEGLVLQRETVDLVTLAADAVGRVGLLPTAHIVRLDVPAEPVVVVGDRDRLGQLLDHLLDNAIRYSPDGGEILVQVANDSHEVHLRVIDQGVGIPAAVLPHVFEGMCRGHSTAGETGRGLGLYLSRMLVEAHGGRLAATSEFGVGSTFTVTLPLPRGPSPE